MKTTFQLGSQQQQTSLVQQYRYPLYLASYDNVQLLLNTVNLPLILGGSPSTGYIAPRTAIPRAFSIKLSKINHLMLNKYHTGSFYHRISAREQLSQMIPRFVGNHSGKCNCALDFAVNRTPYQTVILWGLKVTVIKAPLFFP